MKDLKRMYFLDNLGAFMILLVIVLHAAALPIIDYSGWVHDKKVESLLTGIWFMLFEEPFLMLILFFLAGYFFLPSLSKKDTKKFLKDNLYDVLCNMQCIVEGVITYHIFKAGGVFILCK